MKNIYLFIYLVRVFNLVELLVCFCRVLFCVFLCGGVKLKAMYVYHLEVSYGYYILYSCRVSSYNIHLLG